METNQLNNFLELGLGYFNFWNWDVSFAIGYQRGLVYQFFINLYLFNNDWIKWVLWRPPIGYGAHTKRIFEIFDWREGGNSEKEEGRKGKVAKGAGGKGEVVTPEPEEANLILKKCFNLALFHFLGFNLSKCEIFFENLGSFYGFEMESSIAPFWITLVPSMH